MVRSFGLAIFGLCMGSFANVCIYRLPRAESLWRPPSHCPSCHAFLRWFDNIPLISYILLKGRCRSCHDHIDTRYPFVEALCAILWVGVGLCARWELWILIHGLALATAVLIGSFVDVDCRLIPNEVTIFLIMGGLSTASWNPRLGHEPLWRSLNSLAGLGTGAGLLWAAGALGEKIWKKEAMGLGDVKLAGGLGSCLGWKGAVTAIIVGSAGGAAWGIFQMVRGKLKRRDYIPFGPFLGLGGLVAWFSQCGK